MASSTMVRKKEYPKYVCIEKCPQISMWVRSKAFEERLLLEVKESFLCLAKWPIVQWGKLFAVEDLRQKNL